MNPHRDGAGTGGPSRPDEDTWRSLRVVERYQVLWAVLRNRPLPARLARAVTEHGHQLRWTAFFGYFYLVCGAAWLATAVTDVVRHSPHWLLLAFHWFMAVGLFSLGAAWLAVVANIKRAERAGPWPEG